MKIGLHDADGWKYPNLALMKLSAHHQAAGSIVERFAPLSGGEYDSIFSSKVFTFSEDDKYLPKRAITGGTGYHSPEVLSDEVEHTCPDYSLYGKDYSMGFLTRGCSRSCDWCVVPAKEGPIRAHANFEEFTQHRQVVFLDNNVLAHPHGIEQIEKMGDNDLEVDFNQGLDARLIDDGVARRLSRLNWFRPLRLACGQIESVRKAVEHAQVAQHHTNPILMLCASQGCG